MRSEVVPGHGSSMPARNALEAKGGMSGMSCTAQARDDLDGDVGGAATQMARSDTVMATHPVGRWP